jgi:hypothetical protein
VPDVSNFRCRKGFFAFTVLAGTDSNGKFLMWSTKSAGSANDIECWNFCDMKCLLEEKGLPIQYYFIGDEAFVCSDQFLTPYGGERIGIPRDVFNFCLSVRRQPVERAFGMLTKRCGIFNRPLTCAYDKWTLVARVCAKLHNLCMDRQVPEPQRWVPEHPDDEWNVYLNDVNYPLDEETGGSICRRRKLMMDELQQKGVRRPDHARCRSRAGV